jgi:HAD superfamily hydrolase (TIGR01490 family)
VVRGALAQIAFRLGGASHQRMEKIREQVSQACQGWPADRVAEIVTRNLHDLIVPHVYAEARALLTEHRTAGQDVIIVSTSGQEMVAPIGALLGASSVIATRMEVADGRYTGQVEFYAYGEAKAEQVRALAAERGYSLPLCYAYSDSVTDLPMLEMVGNPRAVNPDRALRRIAQQRGWPVLTFSAHRVAPAAAPPASM